MWTFLLDELFETVQWSLPELVRAVQPCFSGMSRAFCCLDHCMAEGKPEHASSEDRKIPEQMRMLLNYRILVICHSQIAKGWKEPRSVGLWESLHVQNTL